MGASANPFTQPATFIDQTLKALTGTSPGSNPLTGHTARSFEHAVDPIVAAILPLALTGPLGGAADANAARALATEGAADTTTVTESGLNQVTEHLSQFGGSPPNAAMISRLQSALDNGGAVTGADANFYNHELIESNLMSNGVDYEAAHAAALEQAGVSPFGLYHPDVIQQFPEYFNDNWRTFWGLP
jgi:hypothetical protein